jgi:hypothetical protein
VLSYPYAWLPVFVVFGVSATIAIPLFAFVWLAVFFVMAFVAVVALGWGLVAALRALGRRLSWRWLHTGKAARRKRSVPLPRPSEPQPARSASASGSQRSRETAVSREKRR